MRGRLGCAIRDREERLALKLVSSARSKEGKKKRGFLLIANLPRQLPNSQTPALARLPIPGRVLSW